MNRYLICELFKYIQRSYVNYGSFILNNRRSSLSPLLHHSSDHLQAIFNAKEILALLKRNFSGLEVLLPLPESGFHYLTRGVWGQ